MVWQEALNGVRAYETLPACFKKNQLKANVCFRFATELHVAQQILECCLLLRKRRKRRSTTDLCGKKRRPDMGEVTGRRAIAQMTGKEYRPHLPDGRSKKNHGAVK